MVWVAVTSVCKLGKFWNQYYFMWSKSKRIYHFNSLYFFLVSFLLITILVLMEEIKFPISQVPFDFNFCHVNGGKKKKINWFSSKFEWDGFFVSIRFPIVFLIPPGLWLIWSMHGVVSCVHDGTLLEKIMTTNINQISRDLHLMTLQVREVCWMSDWEMEGESM